MSAAIPTMTEVHIIVGIAGRETLIGVAHVPHQVDVHAMIADALEMAQASFADNAADDVKVIGENND